MKRFVLLLCVAALVGTACVSPQSGEIRDLTRQVAELSRQVDSLNRRVEGWANASNLTAVRVPSREPTASAQPVSAVATDFGQPTAVQSTLLPCPACAETKNPTCTACQGAMFVWEVLLADGTSYYTPSAPRGTVKPSAVLFQPGRVADSPRSKPAEPQIGITPSRLYLQTGAAENGSYYGQISQATGRPKTVHVNGYYRKDGTYVRGHYRSSPRP